MAAIPARLVPLPHPPSSHTDISYVVPPTPVTFLTLLWRPGLRGTPAALGWQSICPLTFSASLGGTHNNGTGRYSSGNAKNTTQSGGGGGGRLVAQSRATV